MKRAFTHFEHRQGVRPGKGKRPVTALTAAVVLSALLLAGCSSNGSTSSRTVSKDGADTNSSNTAPGLSASDSNAPGISAASEAQKSASGAAPAPGAAPASGFSNRSATPAKPSGSVIPRVSPSAKLTRNASLDLKVANIETAAARVRAVATGLQAQILSEQIGNGDPSRPIPVPGEKAPSSVPGNTGSGNTRSDNTGSDNTGSEDTTGFGTLTLSVPANKLDAGLDQLARIGTVLGRNATSEDVTSQFVDTQSRLKSMRASVERVRALMAKANDLGQVVALEGELSRRESDLEALESQLSALKSNVERSTVTVSLRTPGAATVQQAGFGSGLQSGWDAFVASATGLAKALGAALPFALFFALVSAPLLWWWRRRPLPAQPVSTP